MTIPNPTTIIAPAPYVRPVDSDAMVAAANTYVCCRVEEAFKGKALPLSPNDRDLKLSTRVDVMRIAEAAIGEFAGELKTLTYASPGNWIPWRALVGWDPIQLQLYVRVMRKEQP